MVVNVPLGLEHPQRSKSFRVLTSFMQLRGRAQQRKPDQAHTDWAQGEEPAASKPTGFVQEKQGSPAVQTYQTHVERQGTH